MSNTTEKPKNAPIAGTVPFELREIVEDYRWEQRLTVSQVLREAVETWAEVKNLAAKPAKSAK